MMMQVARKSLLSCAVALAAVALCASAAQAQEVPVEIVQEPTGEPCDPCIGHATGSSIITTHIAGVEILISECEDEFEGEAYADGSGHIYDYENDSTTSQNCTRIQCNGVGEPAGETEWDVTNVGETGPNEGHSTVRFCLDSASNPNATGIHCDVEVLGFEQGSHGGIASIDDFTCPFGIEVSGEWTGETTTHDNAEAIHNDR